MWLDFADGVGCVWVDDLTSAPLESLENHRFSNGLREGVMFTGLLELNIRHQMLQRFLKLYCLFVYFVGI